MREYFDRLEGATAALRNSVTALDTAIEMAAESYALNGQVGQDELAAVRATLLTQVQCATKITQVALVPALRAMVDLVDGCGEDRIRDALQALARDTLCSVFDKKYVSTRETDLDRQLAGGPTQAERPD